MSEEILFTIYNNHVDSCPHITNRNSGYKYYGYFQNEFGEQWLFIYDYENETGILRGGDVDWSNSYNVGDHGSVSLILNPTERAWLKACYETATAFKEFRKK